MQRYRLEKIIVSTGTGKLRQNAQFEEKILPEILTSMAIITGQHPAKKGAKKSIATFKTRTGDVVGVMVTLRGTKMKDFLNRLVHTALPRVRDFRGISIKNFDDRGNLNIGIKECVVFPEINPEKIYSNFGVQITLVANTKKKEDGIQLFRELGLPIQK